MENTGNVNFLSILGEYIAKRLNARDLETELLKLISEYNKLKSTYLFVYSATFLKNIPDITLNMDDYFIIHDIIKKVKSKKLDFYIETPGGMGEAAEEIAKCLHDNFENISFIISGEAKSAGTILALSGNEISMTETGSLGPIDAQIKIGRSIVSAYDYMEWVNTISAKAEESKSLNPFEAVIAAQISPGEIKAVYHALHYAKDLVKKWLPIYKFKDWQKTDSRQLVVTDEYKRKRASEIADKLTDHSEWRSHGRSLKIKDLQEFLKINKIDDDPRIANIIYRIQTVIRLLFGSTSYYKIFATQDEKILRSAMPQNQVTGIPSPLGFPFPGMANPDLKKANVVEFEVLCDKCGTRHKIFGKLINDPKIDSDFQAKGSKSILSGDKIHCNCGNEIDILGIKNELEIKLGKKFI